MKSVIIFFIAVFVSGTSLLSQTTGTMKDKRDSKTYKTIQIGNQIWMAENLAWLAEGEGCWPYDLNENNADTYGYLYNWHMAMTACPEGWHLPSADEFETLVSHFGGYGTDCYEAIASGGTSGFNAQLGGWRSPKGLFKYLNEDGNYWTNTAFDSGMAYYIMVSKGSGKIETGPNLKVLGLSVRCIKN
jgi:uncharacterized protein (TIGR02145 family)